MPNIVVIGAQWGDEGKGKVVDVITPQVNVCVRFSGGNNAGHTVVVGREKYVLHTIPSGILHNGCRCVIGCGVVVDPGSLIEEMESLVQRGVTLDGNLYISKNAHLIMPYHPALDRASEAKLGARRIGTTGKGVGPAYVDKAARVGIRMADLLDERLFREKVEANLAHKNRLLRDFYDAETFGVEAILNQYLRCCSASGSTAATRCCSRGLRPRCSISTTAPIPTSRRPRPRPVGRPPAPGCRRPRFTASSASPRPTAPGSGRGRSPPR
jgi:adenylosuccinate synthase